jgi:NADPH-dependent ferric siderophore reductase
VKPSPFRMFSVEVARVRRLSPSFVRLTFTGPDLDAMADNGHDQRVKLILPLQEHGLRPLPTGEDWYSAWRLLPDDQRNPIRTYTVRQVRSHARELDVDMVVHGPGETRLGPACRFALGARPGDEAVLLGPDAGYRGVHGGLEFRPPSPTVPLLLAGDETAVPAVANIVRALPSRSVGDVVLEVPHPDDTFDLGAPESVRVTWASRGSSAHGANLLRMVCEAELPASAAASAQAAPSAGSDDGTAEELLWDVPENVALPAADPAGMPLYAWVAGEAATVRAIRRHLVNERGHDRRSVAFMGYWRMGRSEC